MRAQALDGLGLAPQAEREARRAIPLWPENDNPRRTLAFLLARRGAHGEAMAQLDTELVLNPKDDVARSLYQQLRGELRGRSEEGR